MIDVQACKHVSLVAKCSGHCNILEALGLGTYMHEPICRRRHQSDSKVQPRLKDHAPFIHYPCWRLPDCHPEHICKDKLSLRQSLLSTSKVGRPVSNTQINIHEDLQSSMKTCDVPRVSPDCMQDDKQRC